MGDWNFLGGILEEVHIHSTMVGKIWLTILFIFRMLVLGVAAEDVWNDEQADFICNTEQPGCRNVCYDRAFPISLIRYWVLQVIFVSSPSLVYMGHALYRLRALEKARQRKRALLRKELEMVGVDLAEARKRMECEVKQLDQARLNKAPLRGSLLRTYVAHVLTRSVVEVAFMTGQYLLYGFHLYPLFKCERDPCPNAVDCYVSRPTEKSLFMVFMQCIAAISLFLNILEIVHLGYKKIKRSILDLCPLRDELEDDFAVKDKRESVAQLCTAAARKMTITFSPADDNVLQGTGRPNNIAPTVLPLLSEASTQLDLEESRCASQRPKDCSCVLTAAAGERRSPSVVPPEREKQSSGSGSPDCPRRPPKPAHGSTFPALPANAPRRPWRPRSFQCATVLEGKSSDTDSRESARESSEPQGKPGACRHSLSSAAESPDDSSAGSVHSPRLPSSCCKTSITSKTSSGRAPDLQI
uniref:Gap junction protein n=1 Tax=Tetraodon nigroviridis TaxID=99883 RepID=H3CKU6_TETNG